MRSITVKPTHAIVVTAVVAATAWGGASVASGADSAKPSVAPVPSAASAARAGAALVYPSKSFTIANNNLQGASVKCPTGYKVVGGGIGETSSDAVINETRPWDSGDSDSIPDDGWSGFVTNPSSAQQSATMFAVCKKN